MMEIISVMTVVTQTAPMLPQVIIAILVIDMVKRIFAIRLMPHAVTMIMTILTLAMMLVLQGI